MSNINAVEALWLAINLGSFVVILSNVIEAAQDRRSVRQMGNGWRGTARRVQANANLRRELLRLVKVSLFMVIAIPAIQRPGEVALSWPLVALMAVPALLLLNSYLDRRTRRTVAALLEVGL